MISIQTPAGGGMSESRLLFIIVAFFAFVCLVTAGADSVNLFLALYQTGWLVDIVAIAAIFFLMAIHTAQAEQVDVLLVVECNHRAGSVRSNIIFLRWYSHHRMRDTHDIGGILAGGLDRFGVVGIMADDTLGVVAPFAMTAEALTVIRPFETRLAKIVGIGLAAMTFAAWRNLAGRAEVMAGFTSLVHVRHLGMNFMIEMHRAILIDQLIEQHRIGGFGYLMLGCRLGPGQVGAGFEARVIVCRIGTGMTLDAI